jgi:hypothetical protein
MGDTRRNLQTQPKILEKNSEHQICQLKRKFLQKSMVSTLKVERIQIFFRPLPARFGEPIRPCYA